MTRTAVKIWGDIISHSIKVESREENLNNGGTIQFVTNNINRHLNLILWKNISPNNGSFCIAPSEAIDLRDALLEMYPLQLYPYKAIPVQKEFDPKKPVKTRNGLTAKIVDDQFDNDINRKTIVAIVARKDNAEKQVLYYHSDGKMSIEDEHYLDLINI